MARPCRQQTAAAACAAGVPLQQWQWRISNSASDITGSGTSSLARRVQAAARREQYGVAVSAAAVAPPVTAMQLLMQQHGTTHRLADAAAIGADQQPQPFGIPKQKEALHSIQLPSGDLWLRNPAVSSNPVPPPRPGPPPRVD
jgi:hypothetical protein